jgi:integrase
MAIKKLTKELIASLPAAAERPVFVYDAKTHGFGIRLSGKVRTFIFQGWLKAKGNNPEGRKVRVSIGRWPAWTLDQAREQAHEVQRQFDQGINPNAIKRQEAGERAVEEAKGMTLKMAWKAFAAANGHNLKPTTMKNYEDFITRLLTAWLDKPLSSLTVKMIAARHTAVTKENGPRTANNAMVTLSSVWNYTRATHRSPVDDSPILGECPVAVLRGTKQWHPMKRRTDCLKTHEFAPWLNAVDAVKRDTKDHTTRDYLYFLLFTGMRASESARLKWEDVDWQSKSVTVYGTKNNTDFTLPIGPNLIAILERRWRDSKGENIYVFPSRLLEKRKTHSIGWVHNVMQIIAGAVGTKADSPHDLRRTFASVAEDVLGKESFRLKLLLNHKTGNDVTAGYVSIEDKKLRISMVEIETFILKTANRVPSASVTQFPVANTA